MKWTNWATVGCVLLCAGCAPRPTEKAMGQAKLVVGPCLEAMGGLARWSNVGPIHATAIVTIYDEAGRATVNKQTQTFDLPAGTLTASAELPQGDWTATVSQHGPPSFHSSVAMGPEQRQRLLDALATILHRVQGPLNLAKAELPGQPQRVRLGPMDLIRVGVQDGRDGDAAAYYFDARTHLLKLVTSGADAPGQDGTVTLYTYRMSPSGMAFPSRLAVMKIGNHVLIGNKPVLEVEFPQVSFSR